jgi:hypothetical protein
VGAGTSERLQRERRVEWQSTEPRDGLNHDSRPGRRTSSHSANHRSQSGPIGISKSAGK